MAIKKLPEYIINRLKAGEVVERPASVVKELVENSLDAGAQKVSINIHDGGKRLIQIEDDGHGIELSDMELVLERYATSKIQDENDLYNIHSYGFRGEALASISEISKTTILTKTAYAEIASKMSKRGSEIIVNHQPAGFEHGTIVTIEDLFYNVPARLKFLKSSQTEYYYCYQHFVDTTLFHHDKSFTLKKNDKVVFDLPVHENVQQRIDAIFKKDISKNLTELSYENERLKLTGFVSDPHLRFGSGEHINMYVNQRPIYDKVIRKALMDAYARQISPGEYPFALLMLEIKPDSVDVNVHPRKSEVKFIAPKDIYQIVYDNVIAALGDNKIAQFTNVSSITSNNFSSSNTSRSFDLPAQNMGSSKPQSTPFFGSQSFEQRDFNLSNNNSFDKPIEAPSMHNNELGEHQIVGQLRNSYIVVQNNDALFYIDQHALAERIAFEQMKLTISTETEDSPKLRPELLLQPISLQVPQMEGLEEKIEILNKLGFDCSMLGENKLIIYSVPQIFVQYRVDLETLFNHILYLEEIKYDHIMDKIFASKACKGSIKAGQKLSYEQMANLLQEGFKHIPGMFVCQHGRPFFIQIDKNKIDELFDR